MKKLLLQLLCLASFYTVNAQTTLTAGDIVMVLLNTSTTDELRWVPLVNLDVGTIIRFTDCGWTSGGTFRSGEYAQTWTATASVQAGTVVTNTMASYPGTSSHGTLANYTGTVILTTNSGYSTTSDQVIAFQGTDAAPVNIFAAYADHNSTPGVWDADATSANTSADPVSGFSIVKGAAPNIAYTGTVNGDKAAIIASLTNPANWTTSATAIANYTGSITISSLPIELIDFKLKLAKESIDLKFTTATELNNNFFAIERSSDGRTFEQIGEVKGAGTSYTQQDYTYTDEKPLRGINYYRLKQVDFDGQFTYSSVVSVQFGKAGNVVIYPTPATETVNVRLEESLATDAQWQIVDMTGRVLSEGVFAAEQVQYSLPVANLTQGAYILRMTAEQVVLTQQFRKM